MTQIEDTPPRAPNRGRTKAIRRLLLFGGPVVVIVVALALYLTGGRYASTDDAYIQSARADISSNIPGRIIEVDVSENQSVRTGQVLLKLDPRRYQIAVDDAQAALDAARRKITSLQAVYRQRQAETQAAQNTLAYEQREFDRQSKLAASGITSRAQLDQVTHDLQAARDQLAGASEQAESTAADLGGAASGPADEQPSVRQAKAALDRARLELSYTVVYAPFDGVAAKVDQIEPGDYINAAAPLFAVMSQTKIWVEANFKETDLTHVRPGQSASFRIDAYPGRTLKGEVTGASPGTGSSFALLPPENASGNWVKVVQRLPVRLSIDRDGAGGPLAAGMSVQVKVDTHHHRTLFGASS